MDIKLKFTERCNVFKNLSNTLYQMIEELSERIIILDLSEELGMMLKHGHNIINNSDLFDEIKINGTVFNFINKSKNMYNAYVLYFEKEYNLPYLGFKYKNEIISPHIDGQVGKILSKYNNEEIGEILIEVEKRIQAINKDINYLNSGIDLKEYKFYYRNYDGMFEGSKRFNNLEAVIKDFESIIR